MAQLLLRRHLLGAIAGAVCAPAVFAKQVGSFTLPPAGAFILPVSAGPSVLRQCSRSTAENVSRFWLPTLDQIDELEKLLPKYLQSRLALKVAVPAATTYRHQYVGVVVSGKHLIYGNFYAAKLEGLEYDPKELTTPIIVCDGGSAFWGVLFDPKSKTFSELHLNGVA